MNATYPKQPIRPKLNRLEQAGSKQAATDLIVMDINHAPSDNFALAGAVRRQREMDAVPMIMLTACGAAGHGKSCRKTGIQGYLTKPFDPDELRNSIRCVVAQVDPGGETVGNQLVTRHTLKESPQTESRILLVEDYPTNQKVMLRRIRSETV